MSAPRRIRTALNGDQQVEATELDLLHTPALQRLYDLHQLGLTDRVFIDASHSRLQHVVGVLEQVDNILEAIATNLERRQSRRLEYRDPSGQIIVIEAGKLANDVRARRAPARLMGLLHDLTHAPFGHTLEDEIALQPQKHDDPERQADAFFRLLCQYVGWLAVDSGMFDSTPNARAGDADLRSGAGDSEPGAQFARLHRSPALGSPPDDPAFVEYVASLGARMVERARSRGARTLGSQELLQLFRDLRFAMRALLWLDALHKDKLEDLVPRDAASGQRKIRDPGEYPFEQLIDRILALAGAAPVLGPELFIIQRDAYLLDVIGNTICADLLDYAKRDSHFAGLKLDYDVDRIVENFTIVSHHRSRPLRKPETPDFAAIEPFLRTAISIFSHKLRIDVPGELMNLLQVRFYVYQRVLFHPTKCIAGAMLGSAIQLMGWKRLPQHYRFVGDAVFLHEIAEVARLICAMLRPGMPNSDAESRTRVADVSSPLIERLEALPLTGVTAAAIGLLRERATDTVAVVLEDIHATTRLLDRLSARRYHRPVFRLLPNVHIPNFNVEPADVAGYFINPHNRASAEREIERRAGLPRGTVTIHCPSGEGPKKIAEILILSERENGEKAEALRWISRIDAEIFAKHEIAIQAVEDMYRSMWRLVVSVAPPYHARHAEITPIIGRVLYAALRRAPYDQIYDSRSEAELNGIQGIAQVPNDENMVLELEAADVGDSSDDAPSVGLVFPDGRRDSRSRAFLEVADLAVPRLAEANEEIRGYIESGRWAANAPREMGLSEVIERGIPSQQKSPEPPDATLGERRGAQRAAVRQQREDQTDFLAEGQDHVGADKVSHSDRAKRKPAKRNGASSNNQKMEPPKSSGGERVPIDE